MDVEQAPEGADDLESIVQDARSRQRLELRLWLRMLSTTRLISQEIRRRLRTEFGATLPQFDLMAQLERERDGLRLGELSRRTMVTNGNTTGLIDRLEADGLIMRETPGEDRRVTVAKLTPLGLKTFATMARAHEAWLKDMMAEVDAPTKSLLLEQLGGIKTATKAALAAPRGD